MTTHVVFLSLTTFLINVFKIKISLGMSLRFYPTKVAYIGFKNRSYIVNRNFVRQVQHQRLFLIDGTAIPLSRTFGKNIGENLKNKKSDPKH